MLRRVTGRGGGAGGGGAASAAASSDPREVLREVTNRVAVAALNEAGQPTRLRRGFDAMLRGGNDASHTGLKRRSLVGVSRFLDENEPVYGGYIDSWVDQVLGPDGLMPMPLPGDADSQRAVALFTAWAEDAGAVDLAGRMDFYEAQRWCVLADVRDGEALTVLDESGALAFIEGDRLASSRTDASGTVGLDGTRLGEPGHQVIDGVLVSETGAALGYYVHPYDKWGNVRLARDAEHFVPAGAVVHTGFFRRAGQVRGRPPGARIIETAVQLAEYREAVQLAAKLAAVLALVFKTESPGGVPLAARTGTQETSGGGGGSDGSRVDNIFKFEAGQTFSLGIGETVEQVKGEQPSTTYDAYLNASIGVMSAGGLLPRQMLMRDMSTVNFSSGRMAYYLADLAAKPKRRSHCRKWCQRIYAWKVAQFIAERRLPPEPRLLRVLWSQPSRVSVDPDKQVKADRAEVEAGFATPQDKIRERGGTIDEVYDQLAEAQEMARGRGLELMATPGSAAVGGAGGGAPDIGDS